MEITTSIHMAGVGHVNEHDHQSTSCGICKQLKTRTGIHRVYFDQLSHAIGLFVTGLPNIDY